MKAARRNSAARIFASRSASSTSSAQWAIIGISTGATDRILLLASHDQWKQGGRCLADALLLAGQRRLRPVRMPPLAAALGRLPLALAIGSGAQSLRPLAI